MSDDSVAVSLHTATAKLGDMIERRRDQVAMALAGRMDPGTFKQIVLTAYMQDDRLQDCTMPSIVLAALECATVGLRPDGEEASIIPYGGEAQFQPGYIGYTRLMLRAGAVQVWAHTVRSGDHFVYHLGTDPKLEHTPAESSVRGEVTHAYACVKLSDGTVQFEVMDRSELDKVEDVSKKKMRGKTSPAYREWREQMQRKAPLRRLRKWVELSPEASAAFRKESLMLAGHAVRVDELMGAPESSVEERAEAAQARRLDELRSQIAEAEQPSPEDLSPEDKALLDEAYDKVRRVLDDVEGDDREAFGITLDELYNACDFDGVVALGTKIKGLVG